jgi:phosphatidylcholine synthase
MAAWMVHAYTALGLVAGLVALIAVAHNRPREMFVVLVVACIIDATDGTLARLVDVMKWTPDFDGRKLDDITDYLNYVVVPMVFVYQSNILPLAWLPIGGLVLLASGYAFCRLDTPTSKASFTGFPSYWNVVVLYLYLLGLSPSAAGTILLVLVVLVFVPVDYVSPFIPPVLLPVNIVLVVMWLAMLFMIFSNFDEPNPRLVLLSLIFPIFHIVLSHYVHFRARHVVRT